MKHVEIILCTDILEVIDGFNGKKYWAGVSIILDILCIARTLAMVACYLVKLGGSRNFVGAHTPTGWDASLVELQTVTSIFFLVWYNSFWKKKEKKNQWKEMEMNTGPKFGKSNLRKPMAPNKYPR